MSSGVLLLPSGQHPWDGIYCFPQAQLPSLLGSVCPLGPRCWGGLSCVLPWGPAGTSCVWLRAAPASLHRGSPTASPLPAAPHAQSKMEVIGQNESFSVFQSYLEGPGTERTLLVPGLCWWTPWERLAATCTALSTAGLLRLSPKTHTCCCQISRTAATLPIPGSEVQDD